MDLQETIARAVKKSYQDIYIRPRTIGIMPIAPDVRLEASALIHEQARYEDCIALINAQPNTDADPVALRIRGTAHGLKKNYAAANQDLDAAEALLQRELSILHCNKAAFSVEEQRFDDAIEQVRKALDYDSGWYLPWLDLGAIFQAKGDIASTWETLGHLQQRWPAGCRDVSLRQHVMEDGSWGLLRADPTFSERIKMYIEL